MGSTYVRLELSEFETTAVHVDDLLAVLLLLGVLLDFEDVRAGGDASRVGFLELLVSILKQFFLC